MSHDPNKKIAILFNCLDWRLHPQIENYFKQNFGDCDLCVTAGSIKGLIDPATRNYFLDQIDISKRLHDCKEAILTMHMDCGAFGGSANFETRDQEISHHKRLLEQAGAIIGEAFPDLQVKLFMIDLENLNNEWVAKPEPVV